MHVQTDPEFHRLNYVIQAAFSHRLVNVQIVIPSSPLLSRDHIFLF